MQLSGKYQIYLFCINIVIIFVFFSATILISSEHTEIVIMKTATTVTAVMTTTYTIFNWYCFFFRINHHIWLRCKSPLRESNLCCRDFLRISYNIIIHPKENIILLGHQSCRQFNYFTIFVIK